MAPESDLSVGRAMTWVTQRMESWGRLSPVDMLVNCPSTQEEVSAAIRDAPGRGLVAFGAGRSYGDQPLVSVGSAILTGRLDRLGPFDAQTGDLVAESGVTLRDIVRQYLPRGFMPPVCPGTGFVTLGGCIANDVHGKNHESKGGFGQHVQWFDLLLPSGEVRRVSPEDAELFSATVGGMGLTGVILRVCLRLQGVRSNAVDLQEERVPNLEAFIDRFEAVRTQACYSVGWIDGMAVGKDLGRGVLETAEPSSTDVAATTPTRLSLRWDLPSFALSPLIVKAFNAMYYRRIPVQGRRRKVGLEHFLFPLDAIANWNRLYGRRGFFQFQCVLPDQEALAGLGRLLHAVSAWRASSFLAVLKTLGDSSQGMLSFPMRGYTLAMDLPNRDGVRNLLANLEAITLEHHGRVYLAKDAALSASGFRRMYPRLGEYQQILHRIDPHSKMSSDMARRLRIREVDAVQDRLFNTAATCSETIATTSC